ncbi:MAG: response regulator [Pseudomonadota bacterium]
MSKKTLLDGKKILIVDDEPDVLSTLEELLTMCMVEKALSFQEAKDLLETQHFDMAILDIMGVDGYSLLEIATNRGVIAVMLTARALSPDDALRSFKQGAAFYVPKDEMHDIATFLSDVLEALKQGKHPWSRWVERLGAYFNTRFGAGWRDKDTDYWKDIATFYGGDG